MIYQFTILSILRLIIVVTGLALVPCLLLPVTSRAVLKFWAQLTLVAAKYLLGVATRIEGVQHLPRNNGYIIAAKHQSLWETLVLILQIPKAIFIVKRQLLQIPIFGWYLYRSGAIGINRRNPLTALKQMPYQAKLWHERGYNIIIFPEGTRTKPGAKVKYHAGIKLLYQYLKCPVLPAATNSGCYWYGNKVKAGVIILKFLPEINYGLPAAEFMAKLEHDLEITSKNLAND
ncbi:MAG: 1-acyl-sn-glycerol-3-phosphate acyltransferase [Pseudomonadota bacterium]